MDSLSLLITLVQIEDRHKCIIEIVAIINREVNGKCIWLYRVHSVHRTITHLLKDQEECV